jgi:hypothetical protein
MQRVMTFLLVVLVFASACAPPAGEADLPPQDTSAVNTLGSALDWDRSPETAVVRIDTMGGTNDPVNDLNALPFCVLYGDGHVYWLDPAADPEQMLEDRIDAGVMREYLEYVIGSGFYSWDDEADILVPVTEEANEGPLLERISVTLYGETHIINALANWPQDSFANILERCQRLSTAPVLYVPQGLWMSAVPVPARNDVPSLPWTVYVEAFPDVNLAAMTLEAPQWVTGELAAVAWDIARRGRMQITQNGVAYRIIAQIPGLQPTSPPAPAAPADS